MATDETLVDPPFTTLRSYHRGLGRANYIEDPLDEFDRAVLNFILSTQDIQNRSCCELDPVAQKLIHDTISHMAANGELH